jgi:hypothetical protein
MVVAFNLLSRFTGSSCWASMLCGFLSASGISTSRAELIISTASQPARTTYGKASHRQVSVVGQLVLLLLLLLPRCFGFPFAP